MSINKKGLINFLNKIERIINEKDEIPNKISNAISQKGKEILNYRIKYSSFIVSKTRAKNGISYVKAYDPSPKPHIAFIEFGTGDQGMAHHYALEVPLTWQYYYPSQYKATKKNGQRGWHVGIETQNKNGETKLIYPIVIGQMGQGNVWKATRELREEIKTMKFDIFKGGK